MRRQILFGVAIQSLFESDDPPPQAARLASALRALAEHGIYIGTSSWKYEGWLGSIYTPERYFTRGKLSRKKFEAECLKEYAETFLTVGGDFSFYQFPSADFWTNLFGAVPTAFVFGLKVPEQITVTTWPKHSRYGARAGQANETFLDSQLFKSAFLQPLEAHRGHVGVMMFEFGTLSKRDCPSVDYFVERLDKFLGDLPTGWRYAVEIRNEEFLTVDYFAMLSRHNVAHVFNAWTRMPTIDEQIAMPDAFTANFTVARALLQKGRTFEQGVAMFQPYKHVQQEDVATRKALRAIIEHAQRAEQVAFVFVNNRLEGYAPGTIEGII